MENEIRNTRFADVIRPFRRHVVLIIVPFVTIVLTVTVLTLLAHPLYESKAAIYIGANDELSFDADQVAAQRYLVKNQIPILKSRQLAAEVVRRFQVSDRHDSLYILGTRRLQPRMPLIADLLSRFKKKQETSGLSPIELVENFREATRIAEQLETNVLLLIAKSPSPDESAFMVNTWVDAYLEYDQLLSQGGASENKRFLEIKLNEVEKNLKNSENRLLWFQQQENVVALNNETEELVSTLSDFESKYNQVQTDLESVGNQLVYLKNQLDDSRRNFVEDVLRTSNPVLQQLQEQMAALVTEKAAYEAQLIGAGLDVRRDNRLAQLQSRLNGIRDKIIEETSNYIQTNRTGVDPIAYSETLINQILQMETEQQSLKARSYALKRVVDEYAYKLTRLPEKSLRLAQLQRDVQVNRDIYTMLRKKFEEAKIRSTGLGGNIVVVDRGQPPLEPVYPRKRMNLALAIFMGLLLGFGLAFAKDYFEDYVWRPEEIEQLKLKVIGAIPFIEEKTKKLKGKSVGMGQKVERAKSISPYLITRQPKRSAIPEAYRVIRTYIHYKMQNLKANTVLITSPGPGEGKSTAAANIGIASAQKGVRTLLVDCDLRKPVQDLLLNGISRDEGLVTYLSEPCNWRHLIRETPVRRLHLMPAGAPTNHASEMISSRRMIRFIKEASPHYKMIIFDCPPVLPVTDAVVLSEYMKGIVLAVKTGKTTRHGLKLALNRLKSVHAPIWGAILTSSPDEGTGYKTYYESYDE
jgi:succinoglycan biosynthesis transport protein ExoP